jgi:glucose/arabinose dehydrogenase
MRRLLFAALCVTAALAVDSAAARAQGPAVGLRLVADGLTAPVALVQAPDGSGRRFVVDQTGTVRVLTADGTLLAAPFLDVRSRMVALMPEYDERGLLGLAFHPGYAGNGRLFVYYSAPLRAGAPAGYDHTARISEFRVSAANPNRADPASERVLLEVDKPQYNHNGGTVAFGPRDGYLYISIGDGGGADDVGLGHVEDWYTANEGGNGQDIQNNLMGDLLRIDVNRGAPYAIPADNPFAATPGCADGCDETWAYGFRNPYRFSFDMGGARALLVGDAGQNLWEEVSIAVSGGNFGWNVKEGAHCFSTDNPDETASDCPDVVVGGHVYRGSDLPQFSGDYVFGDWSREEEEPDGSLFVAKPRKSGMWKLQQLQVATSPTRRLDHYLLGFGQDLAGEVYVLASDMLGPSGTTGRVYRLVRASG